jgi:hypothetical protein
MPRFRALLAALPVALILCLVVIFGVLIATHLPAGAASASQNTAAGDATTPTDAVPTDIVVVTDTPTSVAALPTATKPPTIYDTATPMPPATPIDTPGPAPVTASLVVAPLSLNLDCRSSTYGLPITITNTGMEQKAWGTATSDPTLFAVGPASSTSSGNTWLYPGQTVTVHVVGTGAPKGTTGTATIIENEPTGVQGPVAGVIAITCI